MRFARQAIALAILVTANLLSLTTISWAQTPVALATAGSDESVIITAASGRVALPPSHAVLSVVVSTRGKTAALASTANSRAQASVLDALESLGYGEERVAPTDYSVRANTDYEDNDKIIDYVASLDLRVRVDSLAALGSIVDAALGAGGSAIDAISFIAGGSAIEAISFIADSVDRGRQEALAAAMLRAKRDAESLAAAAGGRLGRLLEVSTIPPVSGPSSLRLFPGVVGNGYVLIEPHSVDIEVEVYTRWALERP